MASFLDKKSNLLFYYQCFLAVAAVFTFFTNLDDYLCNANIIPYPPLFWIVVFIVASLPLLFSLPLRIKYLPRALLIWCAGYMTISLVWFWLFSSPLSEFQELRNRILSVIFILLMLLILSQYYFVLIWTRIAIFIAGLMAVVNNIYEFFTPLVFGGLNDTGRPAGFYVNANTSGIALTISMIYSVNLLQQKYRVPFVSIIGIGVFLTFSRGAILCWFIAVMILIITGIIPRHQFFYWFIVLGIIIISLGQMGGDIFNLNRLQEMGLLNQNVLERLGETGNPSSLDDDSARARLEVVKLAWQMFAEHPLIGNGIGSTQDLSVGGLSTHNISTHNMYLYFITDDGILGFLVFPLLIYVVTRHAQGDNKYISLAFAASILVWGFFSHTIVVQRFHLLTLSLMATMNGTTQPNKKLKNNL